MAQAPYTPKSNGSFPTPLADKKTLNEPEFGLRVADAIYQSSVYGINAFYTERNEIMAENRVFAQGKQPFQTYADLLGIDGKQSFLNLDYHPRPIAPKFRDIMVNDIMGRLENIECTGLSLEIQKRKDDRKTEAAFKMQHGDFVKSIEQQSGMKFASQNDFTPENEDELELWSQLNDREKEELLMQEGVDFILYNNDWSATKRLVVEDLVDTGIGCTRTYMNARKRIEVRHVRPEYLVYGTTLSLNFKRIPYIGHLERMQLQDVRALYPEYPEDKLYDLAYQYRGQYGNPDTLTDFIADFTISYTRPYDSWLIDIMFFEYKVVKEISYVKGVDNNNNPVLDINKKLDKNTEKKQNHSIKIPTIYKGAWLVGAQDLLEWGEMKDLIRNNDDFEDVKFSYSIYQLNNNGDMLPISPMYMVRSSIIQMDLAILRIQAVMALTPPPGFTIDIDAVMDLNLGRGMEKISFAKVIEMYQQTGRFPYSGQKISGEKGKPPITPMSNDYGNQIKELVSVYNFELNNIRDYLGINEIKDGSQTPDRLGLGVMQGQVHASNMALAHIYEAFISIMSGTCVSSSYLLWDALKSGSTMYTQLLGKENADFIKYNKELTQSNYLTKISVAPTGDEIMWFEKNMDTALQQQKIMPEDVMQARKYFKYDPDRAIRFLSLQAKKRGRLMQQAQAAQQQQQIQLQAQLSQIQGQLKAAQESAGDKRKQIIQKEKMSGEQMAQLQDLINQSLLLAQQGKGDVPKYVQSLIDNQNIISLQKQYEQIEQLEQQLQENDLQMQKLAQQQQVSQLQQQQQGGGQPGQGQPQPGQQQQQAAAA